MAGKSFKGNLEILNLSDIFQSLAMNRHSGTLIVNDGKREKKIYFAEGEVTLLSSSRRMKLGEMLIAAGKITEEDLDLALKLQKQSRKKLGEILVEEGFCGDDDIFKLVRMQIEEEIYDLFLWRKADFEFIADQIPEDMAREAPNLTRLALNTNSLIMEALRRLDEWNMMKDLVPSTKEVFVVQDEGALKGAQLLDRFRPELVDGKTTVEGLAEKMFLSEFDLCKQLAELARDGAIRGLRQEELVDKAEAAYALNDFAAAAAFYGRLAEHIPDQPKVLIPLADSLRRTGADKHALVIYEELAKNLEQSGQEPDRLRQCYESITQLDPSRQDTARKLEELELRLAAAPRRGRLPIVVIVLLLAAGGLGFALRDKLRDAFGTKPPPPGARRAAELLEEMSRAKASRQYQAWFEKAVALWNEFPQSQEFKKAILPILVQTEPAGYEVYINGVFQDVTKHDQEALVCTYDPATSVRLEIKPPKKEGREQRVLYQFDFEDPKKWQGVVRVPMLDEPDGSFIADGWLDASVAWAPSIGAWVGPSRDGLLRAFKVEGRSLVPRDGWDQLKVGERGDLFSPPLVHGNRAYLGGTEGGVVAVDLTATARPGPDLVKRPFPAAGPVRARPVVVAPASGAAAESRLVWASLHGDVHAAPLEGGEGWSADVEARVVHALAALPGLALVAAEARLFALQLQDGKPAWTYEAAERLDGPPLVLGDAVLVQLVTGELALVDGKTGEARPATWAEPGKKRVLVAADPARKRLFVATHDGTLQALDAATLQPVWKEPVSRPTKVPPRMDVFGERLVVALDEPKILGLAADSGRLVWQARFPEQAGRALFVTSFADHTLVSTSKNYVHVFDREDH